MIVHRFEGLELEQLQQAAMCGREWSDGSATAIGSSKAIKRCEVAGLENTPAWLIVKNFLGSVPMRRYMPRASTRFRFVRYRKGDGYGPHPDIVVSPDGAVRCDFSVTILLQQARRGGGLVVEGSDGVGDHVPLEPGDCVVYPSTRVHWVVDVEEGERLAIVFWFESYVRERERRRVLHELDLMSRGELEPTPVRLQALRQELLRQWSG